MAYRPTTNDYIPLVHKLPRRIAAFTSSITAALVLLAVGLTALLAYRAFDASRAQRQMTERTLREYAGFAAFQLTNLASGRMVGQSRSAFNLVVRSVSTSGPTPPLGASRVAELVSEMGPVCRCLDGVSFYYQVTFADSGVDATASELLSPHNLPRLRDTVMAQALAPRPPEPPLSNAATPRPAGVPLTSQTLVTIFSRIGNIPYVLTHALIVDTVGRPIVAYGFAVPQSQVVRRVVTAVLATQPVLPNTLTRGLVVDSILAVTVRTPAGEMVYQSRPSADTTFAATDSLETRLGALRFQVAIEPVAAGRLIIGGLPRSRLPEVLATAFIAVGLLGLLLYQFRRQEELARLRDEFVSGVSHELRTPLAQIRLLAELLHRDKVPVEERGRSLRIIDKESRRLSFLVESILSFTHSRRGQLSPVRTDIATEIEEIVSGFAPLADAQRVQIVTQLDRNVIATVDRGALRQVLLNLLDNAVRYGPAGQQVTITTTVAGNAWTLAVADQGPGIPLGERERVFAPYYRMQRDTGGAVGGTGIGLAVVRRLVEEQGGRVYVTSLNDESAYGARFIATLPIDGAGTGAS